MSWYRTGTVAVTNGSKTVTGTDTLWASSVNVGDAFALVDANLNPTGAWYEVESVTNNTTLVLKQSYAGSTGGNKQYAVFNLVGNMTTPSFAQRLAQFFDSFQGLIDKPTTTPTASSIPIADANGDIDSGWIKDATASVKGVVELATSAETVTATDTTRAVTPAGFLAGLRGNLLGTVSQSGGVPTGAVIESGSNANGRYVKFADGTLVCTGESQLAYSNPSALNKEVTFAAEYINTGYSMCMITGVPAAGHRESTLFFNTLLTTGVNFGIIDNAATYSSGDTLLFKYTIIGRWY